MRLMGWDADGSPICDVALDVAIGKLHRFWYWCLDFAPTGDLRGKNDATIARSVGLAPSFGKRFVEAMVASGWIDRTPNVFRVHDWPDYAGRFLKESRFKNHPEKLKEMADVYRPEAIQGESEDDPRYQTNQPNQPNPACGGDKTNGPDPPTDPVDRLLADESGEVFTGIQTHLQTPRFKRAFARWVVMRRESSRNGKLSWMTIRDQLGQCSKWTEAEAVAALESSVANGWSGVFKPGERNGRPAPEDRKPSLAKPVKYDHAPPKQQKAQVPT